jgi:hypothetical protein
MAVTRAGNVIRLTADDDTVQGPISICGIRYIAGTGSPSVTLKAATTSGNNLYFNNGAASVFEEVEIREQGVIHLDLAGTGTEIYLYTK